MLKYFYFCQILFSFIDDNGARAKSIKQNGSSSSNDISIAERKSWNAMTPELLDCSRAHCYYVMAVNFVNAIELAAASTDPENQKLVPALDTLARLFLLHTMQKWLDFCSVSHLESHAESGNMNLIYVKFMSKFGARSAQSRHACFKITSRITS